MIKSTLERITPDHLHELDTTGREILRLHLERYQFAASHLRAPKRILDLACGVGYSARLLSDRYPDAAVIGVDLSDEAIQYALSHYASANVTFIKADAMTFSDDPFDVVVSLETIEHLPDPNRSIAPMSRQLLYPGGTFIGSVPVTPSVDANPHHLTDFTAESFRRILTMHSLLEFSHLDQVQHFNPFRVAAGAEERTQDLRQNLFLYYLAHPHRAFQRLRSTVIHGFCNKYLTVACRQTALSANYTIP